MHYSKSKNKIFVFNDYSKYLKRILAEREAQNIRLGHYVPLVYNVIAVESKFLIDFILFEHAFVKTTVVNINCLFMKQ